MSATDPSPAPADRPNAPMAEFWTGSAGHHWVESEARYEAMLAPIGAALLDAAALAAGESVLDVGCGTGATTLAAAGAVGADGRVVGVDISPTMLDGAADRTATTAADGAGATRAPVSLACVDAQVDPLPGAPFDVVLSRFGVMFFADPDAAFANLHRAAAPGGRLVFACWQREADNDFLAVPITEARALIGLPDPDPEAPGPFAFASADRVERILAGAGWRNAEVAELRGELLVGGPGTVDDAIEFSIGRGQIADALARRDPSIARALEERIRPRFADHHDGVGVRLGYRAWIVTADA